LTTKSPLDGRGVDIKACAEVMFGFMYGSIANTHAVMALLVLELVRDKKLCDEVLADVDAALKTTGGEWNEAVSSALAPAVALSPVTLSWVHSWRRCWCCVVTARACVCMSVRVCASVRVPVCACVCACSCVCVYVCMCVVSALSLQSFGQMRRLAGALHEVLRFHAALMHLRQAR
jgi:hypothetical protein